MISFWIPILALLTGQPTEGAMPRDSIGIYKTQQDYLDHRIEWISVPKTKIDVQPQFARFPYNVDSDAILYLRQTGRYKQRVRPDSVFGFIRKGTKYLYFSQQRRYMAVLNEEPPLVLVLKEDSHSNGEWSESDDTLLYSPAVGLPLKILNKENILKDFGDNGELASRLTLLSKAVIREQYTSLVERRDFQGYLQMVHDYLYGPLPIRRRHYPTSLL